MLFFYVININNFYMYLLRNNKYILYNNKYTIWYSNLFHNFK